ncbi:MAG: hypothetical protein KA533_05445 [Sphingobium sp.]|nr:hypothetical protein [Sphingobium sp.]MBP6110774.1 hypothetical protein [Sphingobium sp.]MBP8671377.1 hypothetical protein [Sphingobium sp.]MBP9157462.1 hypothetical protein [Sphingobium sp.]MCC6482287.1 hypothetical protein [Sphingomonadaceae bacterium]
MKRAMILALLAMSACGVRKDLAEKPGMTPPPVARGAERAETPEEMTRYETQARPDRSAEPLDRSYERRDDYFDLPPS